MRGAWALILYSEINASMMALNFLCGIMRYFNALTMDLLINRRVYFCSNIMHLTSPRFFDDYAWHANIAVVRDTGERQISKTCYTPDYAYIVLELYFIVATRVLAVFHNGSFHKGPCMSRDVLMIHSTMNRRNRFERKVRYVIDHFLRQTV